MAVSKKKNQKKQPMTKKSVAAKATATTGVKSGSVSHKSATPQLQTAPKGFSLAPLATLWKIGLFPKGAGTIGSLVALPIAYILNRYSITMLWILTFVLAIVGIKAIQQYTADKKEKDPSEVIIDEVVGQLITFSIVISDFMHWPMLIAGFVLFRFFDIFKWGAVAFWDRRKNPVGVMMDDVTAGIFSAFILAMAQVLMVEYFQM